MSVISERARRVIDIAQAAAIDDGQPCGTDYLLWALLNEPEGPHRPYLEDAIDPRELRARLRPPAVILGEAVPINDDMLLEGEILS
jgi:hypothetical protein